MALTRSFATLLDDGDFAAFECCGDDEAPYRKEPENYVRGRVLGKADHVVSFRDEFGELAAVASFDRTSIAIPGPDPEEAAAWKLQVVAIRSDLQGRSLSREVFAGVFAAMREVSEYIDYVIADVHRDNRPSREACARVGLDTYRERDEHFISLRGVLSKMEGDGGSQDS